MKNIPPRTIPVDSPAYDVLYERYFAALCVYCYKYVRDGDIAADIVQDVFMALWKNPQGFNDENHAVRFLYVTARNLSLNWLKRQKTGERAFSVFSELQFPDDDEKELVTIEVGRQLLEMIEQLPPGSRKVLQMSMDGKSYQEIGELLDITVNTVKNHRVRAVKLLKEKLKKITLLF